MPIESFVLSVGLRAWNSGLWTRMEAPGENVIVPTPDVSWGDDVICPNEMGDSVVRHVTKPPALCKTA